MLTMKSKTSKKKGETKTKTTPSRVNFSTDEIDVLENSIVNYGSSIFGEHALSKKLGYEAITRRINRVSSTHRSVQSVKNRVRSDVATAKTKRSFLTQSLLKTGGGLADDLPPLTTYEELLLSFVKDEVLHGIKGGTDTSKPEMFGKFRPPLKRKENTMSSPPSPSTSAENETTPPPMPNKLDGSNPPKRKLYKEEHNLNLGKRCKVVPVPSTSKDSMISKILFGKPIEVEKVESDDQESSDSEPIDVVLPPIHNNNLQVEIDEASMPAEPQESPNSDVVVTVDKKSITMTDSDCQTENTIEEENKSEKEGMINAINSHKDAIISLTSVLQLLVAARSQPIGETSKNLE